MPNTKNVDMKVDGDKLTIAIDLSVAGEPSSTGKTRLLAKTGGPIPVPGHDGISININVHRSRKKRRPK